MRCDARFVYKSVNKAYLYLYRRGAGSAATFFGASSARFVYTFRRQRFSALRLHVASGSGKLFGATRDSADRRPTLTADPPNREKAGRKSPNRRIARKRGENRRNGDKIGTPGKCSTWNAWKMLKLNNLCKIARKRGENRRNGDKIGTPGKRSTWNVNKLLSFNNLCKNCSKCPHNPVNLSRL